MAMNEMIKRIPLNEKGLMIDKFSNLDTARQHFERRFGCPPPQVIELPNGWWLGPIPSEREPGSGL
jgi:hypothetical protein